MNKSSFQIADDKGADQPAQMRRLVCTFDVRMQQSKEESKDQESIQSSTTPDPGHLMEK